MDSILYWNDVALDANRESHTNDAGEQTGPPLSARALAIVHLAMYDALAATSTPPLPAYLPGLPAPAAGASVPAAVAAAAHGTLSSLFPTQKAFFDLKLAQANLPAAGLNEGLAFGQQVAQALLNARKNDPDAGSAGYVISQARGAHRPDPDNPDQGVHAPFYGAQATTFAVNTRHELDEPPQPGTPGYRTALREVRAKGVKPELMGTQPTANRRTVDETLIGLYWGYDGASGLGTPPRLYNQIVRTISIDRGTSEADNAKLFALVNVAMADAGILAWAEKYKYNLWRPVLGVREHDKSMGPSGVGNNNISNDCDTGWLPLGAPATNGTGKNFTPNFPAYPSGHATFGAAALHMTRLFYGVAPGDRAPDDLFDGLTFVSEEFNGVNRDNQGTVRPHHVRNFPGGLWQMIEENGRSRVYLGVHWVFDAFALDADNKPDFDQDRIGGAPLGVRIAEDIWTTGLTPKGV